MTGREAREKLNEFIPACCHCGDSSIGVYEIPDSDAIAAIAMYEAIRDDGREWFGKDDTLKALCPKCSDELDTESSRS